MDFASDANQPGCSNNPECSKYPLNKHRKEYTNGLIIIDTDDSNDSAYETGSSLSRSTQSSPICKLKSFICSFFFSRINYDMLCKAQTAAQSLVLHFK